MFVASEDATAGSVIENAERVVPSSSGISHRSFCSSVPNSERSSMFPVSGAEQLIAAGAIHGLRPVISASGGAPCRFDNPAPYWCVRARNRFQRPRRRASDLEVFEDRWGGPAVLRSRHRFLAEAGLRGVEILTIDECEQAPLELDRPIIEEEVHLGKLNSDRTATRRDPRRTHILLRHMARFEARQLIRGTVIHGDHRGRELGFPTANVRLDERAGDVAFGVYAGRVDGRAAAISVGVRPSFGEGLEPLLEAHILDFSGDLYGSEIVVELVQLLRPELAFANVDELVEQIDADVAAVRAALAEPRRPPRRASAQGYLPQSLAHWAL